MEKHLEIFKHIEELYHGDITDEEMLQYADKNQAKMDAWRDAFEGFLLHDVLNVIDEYFAKKNNRTPPRIAQIKALLNSNNIHDEKENHTNKKEIIEPCLAIKYQQQDREEGNMHWFVPDYLVVEQLIRADNWGFVQNIYKPTLEEFHRCLEYYCEDLTGHKYRFYSDNDIAKMTDEQKQALREKCLEKINSFRVKTLN